jgi:ubiquinone/menaquinone biosynthesis C-methylase UbiE
MSIKDLAENYDQEMNSNFFDLRANIIKKLIKQNNPKNILEVGCGTGIFLDYFHDDFDSLVGVDNCKEMLDYAKKHHKKKKISYIYGNIDSAKLKGNNFDMILSMGILENITDKKYHIKRMIRLLKKKGIIFITTPVKNMEIVYRITRLFRLAAPRYWPTSYISYNDLKCLIPKGAKIMEHKILLFNPSNIKIMDKFFRILDRAIPNSLNRFIVGPQYIILRK